MNKGLFKRCTKCNKILPLNAEHYHRDKTTSTGFTSQCKHCRNKQRREARRKKKLLLNEMLNFTFNIDDVKYEVKAIKKI